MAKIEEDLKKAVISLPPKEKDKLIFKLLRKDHKLAKKLFFELVSSDSVEERRAEVANIISEYFNRIVEYKISDDGILSSLRLINSQITEHIYTTKDKYGEIVLKISVMNQLLDIQSQKQTDFYSLTTEKLLKYVVTRLFNIATLIKGFHPDYYIDFLDSLNSLAQKIENQKGIAKFCKNKSFDIAWLKTCEVPDNIKELSKLKI